jgi:hypothetical protein
MFVVKDVFFFEDLTKIVIHCLKCGEYNTSQSEGLGTHWIEYIICRNSLPQFLQLFNYTASVLNIIYNL